MEQFVDLRDHPAAMRPFAALEHAVDLVQEQDRMFLFRFLERLADLLFGSADIHIQQIAAHLDDDFGIQHSAEILDEFRFPGARRTGKTEFVKYLGAVLNTKVIVKMGSDLLNMYVGGTEQQIRQAFEEAEQEHAILFLDEIDGMLQSRGRAQRSWEVTQVNELLHQMENFNGIMVGATNFSANLDPAVMRRFTFKLEFDYLDEVGKRLFFERMFQSKLTEEEERKLATVPRLAPGDFRTVRQSLFYLGGNISNDDRIEALRRESESKLDLQQSTEKKRIGF